MRPVVWVAGAILLGVARAETALPAPGFHVRSWHIEDGLPDGTVTALAQTPDGYLWVGSRKGLVRFDGVRFTRISGMGAMNLVDPYITGLLAAPDGTLWITSQSGWVIQFIQGEFRIRHTPVSPPAIPAAAPPTDEPRWFAFSPLARDAEGNIWAISGTNTLLRFADPTAPGTMVLDGLSSGAVLGCWSDRTGEIWVLQDSMAGVFQDGHWLPVPLDDSLAANPPIAAPGREQGLWFVLAGAAPLEYYARRRTPDGWEDPPILLPPTPDTDLTAVSALLEDRAGRLWVSAWWAGVHVRQPAGWWHPIQTEGPLAKCVATCLLEDQQGAVWVGTIGEGLHQVVPQTVSTIPLPLDSADGWITTVCAGQDGTVWMGTDGKGVYRWKSGDLAHFGVADGLPSEHVHSVLEDAQTNLWVGTSAGLAVRRGSGFLPLAGMDAQVLALFDDRFGNLWIGTQTGLWRLDGGSNRTALPMAGGRDLEVRGFAEDRAGRIWIAALGSGLWRAEGERVVLAEFQSQLGRADVRSVFGDTAGALWIGTLYGGLFRWDGTRLRQFSMADGLPDDSIMSITPDDAGNLWMSSHNGIFGYARRSLAEYVPKQSPPLLSWHLGLADGLANRGCSGGGQPVAARSPDGRLWVANMVGAATFDPANITRERPTPKVLVESVFADGVELVPGGKGFRARTRTRRFDFHYTAPDLAAARRLSFRYRLEGLDRDWVEAGRTRSAAYSRLPPGMYRFHVMVGGSDGQWHESGQALALQIVPRFWELRWVQWLAVAGLLSLLGGILAWNQRRQLQLRLERLELRHAVEKERGRIARDIHDDLGARLTEIVLMSDPQHAEFAEPSRIRPHLERICGKTRSVLQTLSQIVWTVNPRNDSLPKLLDYCCVLSEELCEASGIRCWHDTPAVVPELPLKVGVRHDLILAVKEALHNVLKHAGATEVWLRLTVDPHRLQIRLEDNGRGFVLNQAGPLGNGLRNMRERLHELGGQAAIDTAPGQGTRVTFVLPFKAG